MRPPYLIDLVAAGHDQRGQGRGGQGGSDRVALLGDVDLAVPLAPDLGRGEHASSTAHVSEGSLSSAVGSSSGHTGNTRDGASSTPGLGGGLVTGLHEHTVSLALILVHVRVDDADHVGPGEVHGSRSRCCSPNCKIEEILHMNETHLIGAVKTTGRVVWAAASPLSSEITETRGLAAADMVIPAEKGHLGLPAAKRAESANKVGATNCVQSAFTPLRCLAMNLVFSQ